MRRVAAWSRFKNLSILRGVTKKHYNRFVTRTREVGGHHKRAEHMSIVESPFDNEAELEKWAFDNVQQFLGECISLGKLKITTSSGKGGIPDGFSFNFSSREWFVLEAELLEHGVWPHIAEQVTRFVVALRNQDTLRKIRDRLFNQILEDGLAEAVSKQLGTTTARLLQEIELFVEGVQPHVVIFIDDTNQDLNDFAHALEIPTVIYRVKKFLVHGQAEYYSPDKASPFITTDPTLKIPPGAQEFDVIKQLGGGTLVTGGGRVKCYKLEDGRVINIRRSKFYEKYNYYWYGLNPRSLDQGKDMGMTHLVFVMGEWGFVVVPIETVLKFCKNTSISKNPDGSLRHYHVLISPEPEPQMYWSNEAPKFNVTEYAQAFE